MITIVNIQIQIFILIIVGFFAAKKGIFSAEARRDMTDIVIYIILPCNIFHSFEKALTPDKLIQCAIVFVIALCSQIFYMIINKFAYNRFPNERRVVMQYATIVNNASFMGLPVIDSVFGSTGILYGSVVLVPLRLFMWTSGLSLFTKTEKKQQFKSLATHPCIWAVILGFAYLFSPVRLPDFLSDTIEVIGSCITFTSMFIVGSILSEVNFRTLMDKACFYYSFIRLVAIPAIIFAVLRLIGIDPIVTGVAVLSSAMPAATMTAILSSKYGRDSAFASKLVFVSTLISLVTLPIITAIMKAI
ncbi:MAG: AEC family transporter [Clostridiales bacterium]|nr:AEC family transporter [Clostridiales bacterium]